MANNHNGHSHDVTSHRMLVDTSDMNPARTKALCILPKRNTSSRTNTPGAKVIRVSVTCTITLPTSGITSVAALQTSPLAPRRHHARAAGDDGLDGRDGESG